MLKNIRAYKIQYDTHTSSTHMKIRLNEENKIRSFKQEHNSEKNISLNIIRKGRIDQFSCLKLHLEIIKFQKIINFTRKLNYATKQSISSN